MAKVTTHPKVTVSKLGTLRQLREKVDREEKARIIALGRKVFARREAGHAAVWSAGPFTSAQKGTTDEHG